MIKYHGLKQQIAKSAAESLGSTSIQLLRVKHYPTKNLDGSWQNTNDHIPPKPQLFLKGSARPEALSARVSCSYRCELVCNLPGALRSDGAS
jgi:hypothetical protein